LFFGLKAHHPPPGAVRAPLNRGGHVKRLARIASVLVAALLMSGAAQAQLFRAYLSVNGNDANPCTVASPCRLLPAALNAVASGGEIWMLDSANYNAGTVNITRDVSILAIPGAVGSFVATGAAPALSITNVNAKLRNVVIVDNVTNHGGDGVEITGGSLDVGESQISAPVNGIAATNATVRVHHSVFRDSNNGIVSFGSSTVEVWNSRFTNMTIAGVFGHANIPSAAARISVTESSFANASNGVIANSESATATMKAVISRSTFAVGNVGVAIQNFGGSGARGTVSGCTFSNLSGSALFNFGSAILESAGNNAVGSTNGAASSGTITNIGTI
jgi:hypothetical protein